MLFCSFAKIILFIAEKDKEKKKSHLPRTWHELAVIVKEVTSVNNRRVDIKAKNFTLYSCACH